MTLSITSADGPRLASSDFYKTKYYNEATVPSLNPVTYGGK